MIHDNNIRTNGFGMNPDFKKCTKSFQIYLRPLTLIEQMSLKLHCRIVPSVIPASTESITKHSKSNVHIEERGTSSIDINLDLFLMTQTVPLGVCI
jgi:hypothetical protein